jgi:hypothetical protein
LAIFLCADDESNQTRFAGIDLFPMFSAICGPIPLSAGRQRRQVLITVTNRWSKLPEEFYRPESARARET